MKKTKSSKGKKPNEDTGGILWYENSFNQSKAVYSKISDESAPGGLVVIEEGITEQIFSIIRSQEAAKSETCFSQYVQTIDGHISKPSDQFVGDCIPKSFCSEFDACAFPSIITMEAPLPGSSGVLPFRLPPSLMNNTVEDDSLFE